MLVHPLLDQLRELRLTGMSKALEEQLQQPDIEQLAFEERLGLLVDREAVLRDSRRLQTRLKKAKFKVCAAMEDIDYSSRRGLDRLTMTKLAQCDWIRQHHNVLITGATGTGKTFLACALAHKACLEGFSARYIKVSRLFSELSLTKVDGRYLKLLNEIAKTDVLVLDDWGIGDLTHEQRRDLLEIFDDRYDHRSTVITSQLPINLWHEAVGDKTLADAIMDRVIHNAYRVNVSGESMRKLKSTMASQEV